MGLIEKNIEDYWNVEVECSYSRNFAGREACYECGARKRVERSPSFRRRDRKSQESRGHGHRPRSFVEVLKAEASKFVPAMAAASTTVQGVMYGPAMRMLGSSSNAAELNALMFAVRGVGRRRLWPCSWRSLVCLGWTLPSSATTSTLWGSCSSRLSVCWGHLRADGAAVELGCEESVRSEVYARACPHRICGQ